MEISKQIISIKVGLGESDQQEGTRRPTANNVWNTNSGCRLLMIDRAFTFLFLSSLNKF